MVTKDLTVINSIKPYKDPEALLKILYEIMGHMILSVDWESSYKILKKKKIILKCCDIYPENFLLSKWQ